MNRSRLALRRVRTNRFDLVAKSAGPHFSENALVERRPVNFLGMYQDIVGSALISQDPRVLLSTYDSGQTAAVSALEGWANKEIERQNIQHSLQRIVTDSLYLMGIGKVAIASPADVAGKQFKLAVGKPFLAPIDFDDFVPDMHARDFSEVGFMAHRYRALKEAIVDSSIYNRKVARDLPESSDPLYNEQGDERISTLGRGYYLQDVSEYEAHVDLWEVYLPRERLILTFADDLLTGAPGGEIDGMLRVQRWIGPDSGPYHLLGLIQVPGNIMYKGPLQDVADLDEFLNDTYRKLMNQTERFKEVDIVQGGADADGNRVLNANDGDMIRNDNPQALTKSITGGPNAALLQMFEHGKDLFSWAADNLEVAGGLAPQSKTLGQDQILKEAASAVIASKQQKVIKYTCEVLKALMWYWWHDPVTVTRHKHEIMEGISIVRKTHPWNHPDPNVNRRSGSFEDLDIQVDPYSLQHVSPQQKLQLIDATIQGVMPLMPLLQQQGIVLDANEWMQLKAKLSNTPEIAKILTIQEPPPQGDSGGGGPEVPSTLPGSTSRTYNRTSSGRPGDDRFARHKEMVGAMMGSGMNGSQNGVQK